MPEGVPSLIAIIVLVILSFLFSVSSTSYGELNEIKIKSLSLEDKRYKKVYKLFSKSDDLQTCLLIGNIVANLIATTLAVFLFKNIMPQSKYYAIVSTAVIIVAVLLFGEVMPKYVAKAYPEKLALSLYGFIIIFYYVLYPLNVLVKGFIKLVQVVFRIEYKDAVTDEELLTIVNEAEEDGTLKQEESNLIRSALEFDDLEVGDIYVPRINVIAISADEEIDNVKKVFEKEAYSRLPVYKDSIDEIVGTIHQKDFYQNYKKKDFKLEDIIKEALFVGEHTKISSLLRKLQSKKIHIAVVIDEYGGTLGIVTVEDIIEELVGEIYDEYDEIETPFKKNEDGSIVVNGVASLNDFFDLVEIIPNEEYDANTVSGWVTEKLSELPQVGRTFDYNKINVEVTKITKKRVVEVKVKVNEDYNESQEDE